MRALNISIQINYKPYRRIFEQSGTPPRKNDE